MKHFLLVWAAFACLSTNVLAQGPPITTDNPIMLAQGNMEIRTLAEIRHTQQGTFTKVPLMASYIVHRKVLLGVYLPLINHNFNTETDHFKNGFALGDIELVGKYQFLRKDQMAKTLRMVVKTVQTLPTGKKYHTESSRGTYQNYLGWLTGYETIKYGLSNELGFRISPDEQFNELVHKMGVGLPLLKPTYPVKQINLYFEYTNVFMLHHQAFQMLYAQGVQYAVKQLAIEAAVQFPLIETKHADNPRELSLFLGTRYVF